MLPLLVQLEEFGLQRFNARELTLEIVRKGVREPANPKRFRDVPEGILDYGTPPLFLAEQYPNRRVVALGSQEVVCGPVPGKDHA